MRLLSCQCRRPKGQVRKENSAERVKNEMRATVLVAHEKEEVIVAVFIAEKMEDSGVQSEAEGKRREGWRCGSEEMKDSPLPARTLQCIDFVRQCGTAADPVRPCRGEDAHDGSVIPRQSCIKTPGAALYAPPERTCTCDKEDPLERRPSGQVF